MIVPSPYIPDWKRGYSHSEYEYLLEEGGDCEVCEQQDATFASTYLRRIPEGEFGGAECVADFVPETERGETVQQAYAMAKTYARLLDKAYGLDDVSDFDLEEC